MARTFRTTVVIVAALGGLLAGCGGGGSAEPPGPVDIPAELKAVPDPCTLVTTQDATAALGKPTKDCELLGKDPSFASARFLSADNNPGSVTIQIATGGRAQFDSAKQSAAGKPEFSEVTGVGEAAFFVRPRVEANVTYLKGPYVVELSVGFVTGPPTKAVAVTLAQQAAARTTA